MNPIGNTSALNWGALNGSGIKIAAQTTSAVYATRLGAPTYAGFPIPAIRSRMRYSMRNANVRHAMMSTYKRNRSAAAGTQVPLSPPSVAGVRGRTASVEAPALDAGWFRDLDLKSFDEPGFLHKCGETVDDAASPDLRLAAAHRCFSPQLLLGRAALGLEGLDSLSRSLFFQRLMPALGLGKLPPGGLDPAFAQYLFQKWFLALALALPSSGDGHGGPGVFPLQEYLLHLTHAMPASVATCTDGSRQAALVQIDTLRKALAERFLLMFPHRSTALQEWVTAALIDLFEPTLTRSNLPPHLGYGSLEWTLLAIGINLIGAQHWDYSHQELVGLAIAVDVFDAAGNASADAGAQVYSHAAVGPVLRMAHAQGKIDLRDADADPAAMLQTAMALFGDGIEDRRRSASIGSFFDALPVRRDVAVRMLRERGLDPFRQFRVAKPRGHGRTLLASLEKSLGCMKFEASYPLVDFFMSDCLRQLMVHGKLPAEYANRLHMTLSRNSHDLLNQRFNKEFDAAFRALSDSVFSEVLATSLLTLDPRDRHFWHCGVVSVRIPSADVLTRIPARASLGAIGAGRPIVSEVRNYEATGGLFAQLTLVENGISETRDYWVTLEPLTVVGFDGDMARVLSSNLDNFFQVAVPEKESLLSLDVLQTIVYRQIDPSRGVAPSLTSLQFVARQLLSPRLGNVRTLAYQMTGPENSREQLYQSLLDLLPLRACIQSISDAQHYRAAFFCATDVLSMIPVLRLGGQVVSQAARVGMGVSATHARRLAVSLLTGVVERDIASRVIASTLRVGKPLLDMAKYTGRWLNPVDGIASGLSWTLTHAGRGSLHLLQRLRRMPILHRLVADVERSIAHQRLFYRDGGFWHVSPHAVLIELNGQRQLQVGEATYLLSDIGRHKGVLTIRLGGRDYLANPESGYAIRPISDVKRWAGQPALPAGFGASHAMPASMPGKPRLCRVRRSDPESAVNADPCNLIEQAPEFGTGFYRLTSDHVFFGVQARVHKENSAQRTFEMVTVKLNNMGVAPYSMQRLSRHRNQLEPVSNNRYFIFDNHIWTAANARLTMTGMLCPFPDRIQATVIGSPSAGAVDGAAASGPYFLAFDIKLPAISGDSLPYYNKFVVPYGNYPGRKDECMGMVELPGMAYKFRVKGGWLALQKPGVRVALEKAANQDLGRFEQYRQINLDVLEAEGNFEKNSMYQMKNADMKTQRRFDTVFRRANELVRHASRALVRRTQEAHNVLLNFLPEYWSFSRKDAFIAAFMDNLNDIQSALPIVRKSKYEIIGFGDAKRRDADAGSLVSLLLADTGYVRAEALAGAMRIDMDFAFINKALIYFDKKHFDAAWIDSLASDLIHELSHARFNSRDTIGSNSDIMLYPRISDAEFNGVDIGSLVSLIRHTGSESINHASTFEHLIMILAYTESADTRPLLKNILNGEKSYGLRRDRAPPCVASCTVLR